MDNFGENWQRIHERQTCQICEERDSAFKMIKCSTEECPHYFHKACVNPLWTDAQWAEHGMVCDECADVCLVCGESSETEESPLIECDGCEELFHWGCLEEDERCPFEEIGDEEAEWLCPNCFDPSEEEWAREHIVDDDQLTQDDRFTRNDCSCQVCSEMNWAVDNFDSWQPETMAQQAIKRAIESNSGLLNTIMSNMDFLPEGPRLGPPQTKK